MNLDFLNMGLNRIDILFGGSLKWTLEEVQRLSLHFSTPQVVTYIHEVVLFTVLLNG